MSQIPVSFFVQRNYIDGFILSYVDSSTLNISEGVCSDDSNTSYIESTVSSHLILESKQPNTTYHIFTKNTAEGVVFFEDTSPQVTGSRRIGSVITDSSSNIISFIQRGDVFLYSVPQVAVNQSMGTLNINSGAPSGIVTEVFGQLGGSQNVDNSSQGWAIAENPDTSGRSIQAGGGSTPYAIYGFGGGRLYGDFGSAHWDGSFFSVLTNDQGQIRMRGSNGNCSMTFIVFGWVDKRGKQ